MRRRGRQRISHVQAGLIALVVVLAGLFIGFNKGLPIGHYYTVDAMFRDANGLLVGSTIRPGSPVRIAGVNVGSVAGIEKGPGGTAKVKLRIDDPGRPLHEDATAKIRPRLFLEGNFIVDVKPGSPSAPELKDGGTIPLASTSQPVQLDQVLDTLQASTRRDLQGTVRELAVALDKGGAEALNETYKEAPGALRNAAIAAGASLGTEPHDVSELVAASARTAAAFGHNQDALADIVGQFDRTVTALADRREQLASGLRGIAALEAEAPARLAAVDSAVPPLRRFVAAVKEPLEQAPPVLDLAIPFLTETARLVRPSRLPALVRDLAPTVRTLADLEPRLNELFALVTPVAGCVRTRALPVLNSKVDDGPLSSNQKVWEEVVHAATGLTSASQNFDGNGFSTRFSFGLSQDVVATGSGEQQNFALGQYQGSRPAKPAQRPPFNPRAKCEDQALPDLRAEARPATGKVVARLSDKQVRTLASSVLGGGR